MSKNKNRATNRYRFEESDRKQDEKRNKVNHRRAAGRMKMELDRFDSEPDWNRVS